MLFPFEIAQIQSHPLTTPLLLILGCFFGSSIPWLLLSHFFYLRAKDYPDLQFEPYLLPSHFRFILALLIFLFSILVGFSAIDSVPIYSAVILSSGLFLALMLLLHFINRFPLLLAKPPEPQHQLFLPPADNLSDVAKDILYQHFTKKPDGE